MRPSSSGIVNPSGLVDKRLQPMWTHIEQVRELLPQIAHVSYYMESIFNLDRNLTLLADENVDHNILKDIQIFQGANAYEIALAEGYIGDVTSWLASLVGPKGDTGLLDTAAHQVLIDGIAANAAAALAAQAAADAATANFANYVTQSTYDTRVAAVDLVLNNLETTITDVVIPLLPIVRTNTEITNLAQAAIDTSLISVNNAISLSQTGLTQAQLDILDLDAGLANTNTAFGQFVFEYNDTLTAITTLQATSGANTTAVSSLQTASATAAANITTLQATDATFTTQITDLQTASADAATQINVLQTSNNDNYAAIINEQNTRITALDAAATDRALIRTEFASADSGVLSSATALVDAESSARTTALAAAASDRTLIRTEFANADDAVEAAAAALVSSEASARSSADAAEAAARLLVEADLGDLSGVVSSIAEAYATNSGTTARLLWQVATGTNVASIVQSAATGYSDGTWNGSAIALSADQITLFAQDINFGNNTVFEDTYNTFYNTYNSFRLRWGGPFGATSNLIFWRGPTSVALNSETTANGTFALGTDGKTYDPISDNASSTPSDHTMANTDDVWETVATLASLDVGGVAIISYNALWTVSAYGSTGAAYGTGLEFRILRNGSVVVDHAEGYWQINSATQVQTFSWSGTTFDLSTGANVYTLQARLTKDQDYTSQPTVQTRTISNISLSGVAFSR